MTVDKLTTATVLIIGSIIGLAVIGTAITDAEVETTIYENVDSTSEWENAINDAESSDYSVDGDTVTITGDTGIIQTYEVFTDNHDVFELTGEHLQGETEVTIYDGSDDSVLEQETVNEDVSFELDVEPYEAESYYLEYDALDTDTDSEVNSYSTEGVDDLLDAFPTAQNIVQYLVVILALFVLAAGVRRYIL